MGPRTGCYRAMYGREDQSTVTKWTLCMGNHLRKSIPLILVGSIGLTVLGGWFVRKRPRTGSTTWMVLLDQNLHVSSRTSKPHGCSIQLAIQEVGPTPVKDRSNPRERRTDSEIGSRGERLERGFSKRERNKSGCTTAPRSRQAGRTDAARGAGRG